MSLKLTRLLFPTIAVVNLGAAALFAEDEPPKVIRAEDAAAHATETVTVAFTVKNSNQIKDRNGNDMVFLNSMKDYRDDANFTVVIFAEALAKFRKRDVKAPATHYRNKKVRVTGGIELRRGKPQIILKSPEQITIVKEQAAKEKTTG